MTKSEQYYQKLMQNDKVYITFYNKIKDDEYDIRKNNNGTYDIDIALGSNSRDAWDWEYVERTYRSFTKDGIKEFIKSIESIDD